MSTSPESHSEKKSIPENGGLEVEPENDQPSYPPREYKLEDFSQQRINRGQQEINYLIVEADKKIVSALDQLKLVVSRLAGPGYDWTVLDGAIKEVSKATERIAGPFPPGCLKPQSEE